jgi:hypothetical protein
MNFSLRMRGLGKCLALWATWMLLGCGAPKIYRKHSAPRPGPVLAFPSPGVPDPPLFINGPEDPCTRNAPPVVQIAQISDACGEVEVPLTVQNFCDIGAISLSIDYNISNLEFIGYKDVNLDPRGFDFNGSAPGSTPGSRQVRLAWSSIVGSHINSGPLITLRFRVVGSSTLIFDQPNGNNTELASSLAITISSVFQNGGVNYATSACQ